MPHGDTTRPDYAQALATEPRWNSAKISFNNETRELSSKQLPALRTTAGHHRRLRCWWPITQCATLKFASHGFEEE